MPPVEQTRISRFFSASPAKKRGNTPIDLTLDDEAPPPAKRHKGTPLFLPDSPTSHSQFAGRAERWKFGSTQASPLSAAEATSTGPESEREKRQRHDAFKRKLLAQNNPLVRRASEGEDAGRSDVEETEGPEDPESSAEEGDAFQELQSMFAHKGAKTRARPRSKFAAAKGKKKAKLGPSGQTWTPLEEQVLKLKEDNPGTLLMVAVGYKYKFYGEDANIASKELGIACFRQRNFLVATAPIFRREIYVKKCVGAPSADDGRANPAAQASCTRTPSRHRRSDRDGGTQGCWRQPKLALCSRIDESLHLDDVRPPEPVVVPFARC